MIAAQKKRPMGAGETPIGNVIAANKPGRQLEPRSFAHRETLKTLKGFNKERKALPPKE
jgi:hypothetical protein